MAENVRTTRQRGARRALSLWGFFNVGFGAVIGSCWLLLVGDWMVEGLFGYYDPDSVDDNGEIYGARGGYRVNDNFAMVLSSGLIDLEDDFVDIESADLQFSLMLTEDGVSPNVPGWTVLISLIAFTAVYASLAVVEFGLIRKAAQKGPDPLPEPGSPEADDPAASHTQTTVY